MSKDLLDRLAHFEGVTWEDALTHALPLEGPVSLPGVPIGITDDSAKSPVGSDFTLQRRLDDNLGNKSIGVIGVQGIGKTFLLYVLLYIWCAELSGENAYGIQIDSLKRNNNKRPETAPLVEDLLKCVVIQANKIRMNPLSPLWEFTLDELYGLVKTMLEVWWERSLTAKEEHLLDHYLGIIYDLEERNFSMLAEKIASYRAEKHLTPKQGQSMEATALELSKMVLAFTRGDLGKLFGDNGNDDELRKLIGQFAKSWDFHGINTKERSIIEVFRGAIESSALSPINPADPNSKPRHPERVPQFIGRDEAYDAWQNAFFAAAEFLRLKTLRERDITIAMCFHRLADFLSSVGSKKARNALREISVWFIGRQSEADKKDLREFLNLPENVLRTLPNLPKGHFWLIMPGSEPRLFTVIGTPLELRTFVTNQANEAQLERYLESMDLSIYMDWLVQTSPEPEEETPPWKIYDPEAPEPDLDPLQPQTTI